jgi:hypothetical protein
MSSANPSKLNAKDANISEKPFKKKAIFLIASYAKDPKNKASLYSSFMMRRDSTTLIHFAF